jgi:hypothetical protein
MAGRFDINSIGAPAGEAHRHHRLRAGAALVAAVSGAVAVLVVAFIAVAGVGPGSGSWAWYALPVLVALWLSGLWWRWDAPDRRSRKDERERRGF